jgi:ribosomal-protein-alanine N-acetyltransferase
MIETERLILRDWVEGDRVPFARMNADPRVMRYFPATLDGSGSDRFADAIARHLATHHWGLWAVEVKEVDPFIGFVGLNAVGPDLMRGGDLIEIGWRLARRAWGRGYATEGATSVLADAFGRLRLAEVVSFTSAINHRSIAVMRRIGMTRRPDRDFDHPRIPAGHPLQPHVVYAIERPPGTRSSVG